MALNSLLCADVPLRTYIHWYRFLGSQSIGHLVINLVVDCHYFPPGPRLPSQPKRINPVWLVCLVTEAHRYKLLRPVCGGAHPGLEPATCELQVRCPNMPLYPMWWTKLAFSIANVVMRCQRKVRRHIFTCFYVWYVGDRSYWCAQIVMKCQCSLLYVFYFVFCTSCMIL